MGYTHYWEPKGAIYPVAFKHFSDHCARIIAHTDVPLAGGDGKGTPICDASQVCFNGQAPDDYETFYASTDGGWAFCKTARRPYDPVVCACLLALEHHLQYRISSDGEREGIETGRDLFEATKSL